MSVAETYTDFEPVAEEVPEYVGAAQAVEEQEVYTDFEHVPDPETIAAIEQGAMEVYTDFRHSPAGSWAAGLLGWEDDEDRRMQAESSASLKEKRDRLESLSHVALRKKSDEYRNLAWKNRWVTRDDLDELSQEAKTLLGRDVIAAVAPAFEEVPDLYLEARGILPKDGKPRKRTELYRLAWADFEKVQNKAYDKKEERLNALKKREKILEEARMARDARMQDLARNRKNALLSFAGLIIAVCIAYGVKAIITSTRFMKWRRRHGLKALIALCVMSAAGVMSGYWTHRKSYPRFDELEGVTFGIVFGVSFWFAFRFLADSLRKATRKYRADNAIGALPYASLAFIALVSWIGFVVCFYFILLEIC